VQKQKLSVKRSYPRLTRIEPIRALFLWGVFFMPFYAQLRFDPTAVGLFSFRGEICPIAIFKEKSKIGGFQT